MNVKIGFTGTSAGMTEKQYAALYELLKMLKPKEGHHGDCVGADDQFHNICVTLGMRTVVHPPKDEKKRAFCKGDEIRPPYAYLTRNRHIVDDSEFMFAAPKEAYEPAPARGQGTWSTVRYARKRQKSVIVVWPNGDYWVSDR